MIKFFKELYENKYHLKAPKITRVKDGIYIYSEGGKIFINEVDFNESPEFYNTYLENAFELGLPAASVFFLALLGLVLLCFRGVRLRQRDWVYPATGVAVSVLVGLHATVDFSLQIPAIAFLYATIMGIACAQSFSSVEQIR